MIPMTTGRRHSAMEWIRTLAKNACGGRAVMRVRCAAIQSSAPKQHIGNESIPLLFVSMGFRPTHETRKAINYCGAGLLALDPFLSKTAAKRADSSCRKPHSRYLETALRARAHFMRTRTSFPILLYPVHFARRMAGGI